MENGFIKHISGNASKLPQKTIKIINGPINSGNIFQLSGLPEMAGSTDPLSIVYGDILQVDLPMFILRKGIEIEISPFHYFTVQEFIPDKFGKGVVKLFFEISIDDFAPSIWAKDKVIPNNTKVTVLGDHNYDPDKILQFSPTCGIKLY